MKQKPPGKPAHVSCPVEPSAPHATEDTHAKRFDAVLGDEIAELLERRAQLNAKIANASRKDTPMGVVAYDLKSEAEDRKTKLPSGVVDAHKLRPLGMCLSGGGIRSATFNLGVIQGLCAQGLLPYIDYLSTVSGGGYIGTWLHGVTRNWNGNPAATQDHLMPGGKPSDPEHDPVTFLRKYSNYLAPHLGIFDADTWTIAGVWLRNMVLNLLIAIPFLAAVVLLARTLGTRLLHWSRDQSAASSGKPEYWWFGPLLALVFVTVALVIMASRLLRIVEREFPLKGHGHLAGRLPPWTGDTSSWTAVGMTMLAACILGAEPKLSSSIGNKYTFLAVFSLFLLLQLLGGFIQCYCKARPNNPTRAAFAAWTLTLFIAAVCGGLTAKGLTLGWSWLGNMHGQEYEWIPIAAGPALTVMTWTAGVVLQIGLMGADFPDTAREWLTQFGSLLGIVTAAWTGLFVLSVFGPLWLAQLTLWKMPAAVTAVGGWIGSGISSYFAGVSSKTKGTDPSGTKGSSPNLEKVAAVAPPVFMALTFLLISFGAHMAVRTISPHDCAAVTPNGTRYSWLEWLVPVRDQYWCSVSPPFSPVKLPAGGAAAPSNPPTGWWESGMQWGGEKIDYVKRQSTASPESATAVLWMAGFILAFLLSLRFNINEFSMHHFYKNRLVRCYLGAGSALHRRPDLLTGFDSKDDFKLSSLRAGSDPSYLGPYPIVNCALNLNTGSELATAERKASSFVFTPKVCGFEPQRSKADEEQLDTKLEPEGYRDTLHYMMDKGPDLGTTTAISGAAANPNCGYHTSTPLAFLLTIMDVRLGWWVGNPRRKAQSRRPGPRVALVSLFSELFAQTDNRSRYVNLSDGGHFENLGLYELVRRRCRYVIACDAEEDPDYSFEALGGAIRKCRADFGVEIEIDTDSLKPEKDKPYSPGHCVVGTIRYPEADHGTPQPMCQEAAPPDEKVTQGWLVYFKASMTGDEPEDIQQYRVVHPVFPHEPTLDQFFTESQFESYRKLGEHVVTATFDRLKKQLAGAAAEKRLLDMFQDLYRKWHPAGPDVPSGNFTERYTGLMDKLAGDADLEFIGSEFFPGRARKVAKTHGAAVDRKAFFYCLDVIQLMEDVFFQVGFESKSMQYNPEYVGWMVTFRSWARSSEVQKAWAAAKDGYSLLFQEFLDNLIKDETKKENR
jgi:hypothetical protein